MYILDMTLGDLEKKLMDYIWDTCPECNFTVRDIVDGINKHTKSNYAYNTILTVVTHLFDKKLLQREKSGKTFFYKISLSKEAFVKKASRAVFEQMKKDYGSIAVAHFSNLLDEVDPSIIAKAKKELSQK